MLAGPHLAPAMLVLLLVACGEREGPMEVEPCPDNLVAVSVQHPDSPAPAFTWVPPCAVSVLQVSAMASSQIMWSVSGRLQNIIASGVVYGQRPFGAEEDAGPHPLLAGMTYEVRVQRAVATPSGTGLVGGGTVTFTR